MSAGDYYRQRQVGTLRRAMQYSESEYERDWKTAIALAQIMTVNGESEHLQNMLGSIFERLEAYYSIWLRLPVE